MSRSANVAAAIYAKDLTRMGDFYQSVAGLELVHTESGYVTFAGRGFELFLVAIPPEIADTIVIADPPERRTENPIKLIFDVDEMASVRAVISSKGGELNPPDLEWQFGGFRVCDGHDPEGNVIQFRARTSE